MSESFLTRTSPPKGAETFLATAVVHGEHTEDGNRLYLTLTGALEQGQQAWTPSHVVRDRIANATPRGVLMLALALLVCEWESTLSRNTWRRPTPRDRRYLTSLIGWGYQPSDVERLILAQPEQAEPTSETEPTDEAEPTEEAEPNEAEPPYQKDGEWWYRHTNAVSGEVRPRGPFASREDAVEDDEDDEAVEDDEDTQDTEDGGDGGDGFEVDGE